MDKKRGSMKAMLLRGALGLLGIGAIAWLERRDPLRRERESKLRRDLRNLALAAGAAAAVQLVETPAVHPLSRAVARRGWGLLMRVPLPRAARVVLGLVWMDYTMYAWHVLTHRVPLLWRFHAMHHADLDLDALTGLRFHAGEMLLSVPWRAAQVLLLGIEPATFRLWQAAYTASVLFHHSNLRLPKRVEDALVLVLTTPRMHGIHHSTVPAETNSNWSSGLSLWDRLHGTLRLGIPQGEITIGLAHLQKPEQVTLPRMVVLPFDRPTVQALTEIYANSWKGPPRIARMDTDRNI